MTTSENTVSLEDFLEAERGYREEDTAAGEFVAPGATGAMWCYVPVPVRSKSNARRSDTAEAKAAQRKFKRQLTTALKATAPADWNVGDSDLPVPRRPWVVAALASSTMLDTTNTAKTALDAAEGILYHNDASIRASAAFTVRSKHPGLCLAVVTLDPEPSPELLVATTNLALVAAVENLTARLAPSS